MWRRVRTAVALDLRSLAVLRIGLGCLLLIDLAIRASDFTAMYTDDGFAPVEMVRRLQDEPLWSLHLVSGARKYQAALFVIAAAAAAALAAGYHTRLATAASWVLLTSLQVRLPVVINAGDTLLRMLLFWGMFLPLGGVWSIDGRRRPRSMAPQTASLASFAFIVQLAIVYWVAGIAKWNDSWLRGDALHDILRFGLYSLPLASELSPHVGLTRWLGQGTVWMELAAPFLLFSPWRTGAIRVLLIATFVLFHAGIALTLTVGLFSYVAIVAWLALLPGGFWEWLGGSRRRSEEALAANGTPAAPSAGRWIGSAVVGAALAVVVLWNGLHVARVRLPAPVNDWFRAVGNAAMLRQAWSVFGRPARYDCWFVYEARLVNGQTIDLWDADHLDVSARPPCPSQQFANHRWRKLHWRLRTPTGEPYRQSLAEYVCRRWNRAHPAEEQIARLNMYCYRRPLAEASSEQQVRESLAQVVLTEQGGNFADAVRGLSELP